MANVVDPSFTVVAKVQKAFVVEDSVGSFAVSQAAMPPANSLTCWKP